MKRFISFSLGFAAAFIAFSAVTSVIFLTLLLKTDKTDEGITPTAEGSVPKTAELLVIYREKETVFCCDLTLNITDIAVESTSLDISDPFDFCGDYELAEKCLSRTARHDKNFIILSQESFIKIADKSHGLVYNNGSDDFLLTGLQASAVLTADTFAEFCKAIALSALKSDPMDYFNALNEVTVNNLSFPKLYNFLH